MIEGLRRRLLGQHFRAWRRGGAGLAAPRGRRLVIDDPDYLVYAVGDIHGCLAELRLLEQMIVEDSAGRPGRRLMVMLGDYVDRGPASAGVLDHLTGPPPAGFERVCLMGNHEAVMLEFLQRPSPEADWLAFGGGETLASYGIDWMALTRRRKPLRYLIEHAIPDAHRQFLSGLALSLTIPGYFFCHAGARPGRPLASQDAADLLWIREPFLSASQPFERIVVHGHTPQQQPVETPVRIGIDTGAFATGRLTAVRLAAGNRPQFLTAMQADR